MGLALTWLIAVGVVAAAARVMAVFALDGPARLYVPLTLVVRVVALAAILLTRPRAATRER
ncbi:hypothetical protein [Actinomycetospora aeridis]|uniref:Uncharacterized protein n=1 Tax=Actinomycetospora aeridis TaxID=3129231 RepID=A0ABU8NAJ9_9PSEU